MFRPFSFDGASRPPSDLAVDLVSDISPTASLGPLEDAASHLPNLATLSVAELQLPFDPDHLETEPHYWTTPFFVRSTPPRLQQDHCSPQVRRYEPSAISTGLLSVRARRQINARLQCNPSHVEKISVLVEKMIAHGEQCSVRDRTSRADLFSLETDSGEDSGIECEPRRASASDVSSRKLKYRRSADLREGSVCVRKTIRQRRRKDHRRKSDDK